MTRYLPILALLTLLALALATVVGGSLAWVANALEALP